MILYTRESIENEIVEITQKDHNRLKEGIEALLMK